MRKHGGIEEICRLRQAPGVIGTRDGFGIGRNFKHQGKEITTWKEWEKAGYGDVKNDTALPHDIKEGIKEKKAKIRRGNGEKTDSRVFNRLYSERPRASSKGSRKGGESRKAL